MSIIIAMCGLAGSGKTTAATYLSDTFELTKIKLGVTDYVMKEYGKTTEELERRVRNELRQKNGMGIMVEMAMEKIYKLYRDDVDIIIENMYSWAEYKILRKKFRHEFIPIAILAEPEVRYQRLMFREDGRVSYKDQEVSRSRDYSEIENIEKGGPIAMSEYFIVNEDSEVELGNRLDQVASMLKLPRQKPS